MIISDRHRMAFLHIPKCAGSTIMVQLGALNDFHRHRGNALADPRLADVDTYHLTLDVLEECYPGQFSKLRTYDSYALVREPRERFVSALCQYLREFRGIDISRHSSPILQREARADCAQLKAGRSRRREFIHFQTQSSFVSLRGERIVSHLYAVHDLAGLAADLKARHGLSIDTSVRANQTRLSPNAVFRVARAIALPLYRRFPGFVRRDLLRRLYHFAANDSAESLKRDFYADASLAAFVDDYYREDSELYRDVRDLA